MIPPSADRLTVPVSVVLPTIGRADMVERCLGSLAGCVPLPDEVLVVDQSGDPEVEAVVRSCSAPGVRLVRCDGPGVSRGVNRGLAEARSQVVLVTSDDCTVTPDWIGVAWDEMERDPDRLISGRILPAGDSRVTPSIRTDPRPRTYVGRLVYDGLSGNNLVLNRELVLAAGGFDERMTAAEDSDLCYRWLRAGGTIAYLPELVVVHHDWRTPAQLEQLYVRYWRGGGWFYGKHLRAGDLRVLPLLLDDLVNAVRGGAAAVVKDRPRWADARRGFLRGFMPGFIRGWRAG
jgi:GT2 family glycosyltransferase